MAHLAAMSAEAFSTAFSLLQPHIVQKIVTARSGLQVRLLPIGILLRSHHSPENSIFPAQTLRERKEAAAHRR
jgi:hypothetical protein